MRNKSGKILTKLAAEGGVPGRSILAHQEPSSRPKTMDRPAPAGRGNVYKALLVWLIALLADAAVAGSDVGAPGLQHDGAGRLPHWLPAQSRRVSRGTHPMSILRAMPMHGALQP